MLVLEVEEGLLVRCNHATVLEANRVRLIPGPSLFRRNSMILRASCRASGDPKWTICYMPL